MNFNSILKKITSFETDKEKNEFVLYENDTGIDYDVRNEDYSHHKQAVSTDIEVNMAYIKKRFAMPLNNDFVMRTIRLKNDRKAFLVFIEGMANIDRINEGVIKTLLSIPYYSDFDAEKYGDEIMERFVAHAQVFDSNDMDVVAEEVNFGGCAVFVDGCGKAFLLDVRTWSTRSIGKPENEQSIYGPQEAFAEVLRSNTALVRKIIKTEKLIAEGVKIGTVSKTRGVMMYISDIVNEALVNEVRRRINSITLEYVIAIEEVELMVEEKTFSVTTQLIETERPDRVAKALTEGKVALILNGSSKALIFPTSIFELTHAVSDDYLRLPYANMSRIIKIITTFASLLLPGLYIATTLFHQEVIPTYLLYSISASRENVPFPSVLELILMDVSFEMIREAGIRMPGRIGSTLGIVGGLILGQAAVSAQIVSPIMIIIIAITGIGSFATVDYSLGWNYRIMRLIFIVLGTLFGFYGIAGGLVVYSIMLGAQKSFGVPFLSPLPKVSSKGMENSVFINPIWKREKRSADLKTKDNDFEPPVSRKWKQK